MRAQVIPLAPSNALITTAEVTIKMVQIGRKQVTLSVFRQIPYEGILTGDGRLKAPPWGWVNYWWDGARAWGKAPRLHVLWQSGGELRRACVPVAKVIEFDRSNPVLQKLEELSESVYFHVGELAQRALISEVDEGKIPGYGGRRFDYDVPVFGKITRSIANHDLEALRVAFRENEYEPKIEARRRLNLAYDDDVPPAEIEAERKRMQADARRVLTNWSHESHEDCVQCLKRVIKRAEDIVSAWQSSYGACEAAGQLFIAV